jgi:hypothetical protein
MNYNLDENNIIDIYSIKKELYKKILFAEYLLLELEEILEKNDINKKKFEKEFEKEIDKISKNKQQQKVNEKKIDDIDTESFGEEIEIDLGKYTDNNNNNDDNNDNNDNNDKEEKEPSILSKLYKILALKFHPDKNPNNKEYEIIFKNVNDYNKQKKLLFMIILCKKYDVKFNYKDISEFDQKLIDSNIKEINQEILNEKNKVHWLWFNSDEENKKNIKQRFMNLNNI